MFTDQEFNRAAQEARKAFDKAQEARVKESLNDALHAKRDAESDGAFDVATLDIDSLSDESYIPGFGFTNDL